MGVIASLGSYSKQGWPQCGKGFKKGLCILRFHRGEIWANKLVGVKAASPVTAHSP